MDGVKNTFYEEHCVSVCSNGETSVNVKVLVRELRQDERYLLKDFLYEAIFLPDGISPLPYSVTELPELRVYIDDFGAYDSDRCLVACVDNSVVGAVWTRIINDYGHVDDHTPSLAVSLYKEYRGKGIGTCLLRSMLRLLHEDGFGLVSLSVQKANPAVRLYKRLGFVVVKDNTDEYVMLRRLNVD